MKTEYKAALIIAAGIVIMPIAYETYVSYTIKNLTAQMTENAQEIGERMKNSLAITAPSKATKVIKVWVPGKPLKECMSKNKEINEDVLRCRNGFYKEEFSE